MQNIYGNEVNPEVLSSNLKRLTNQVFRLLPANEEGEDWVKPLETILIEIAGLSSLYPNNDKCFTLLTKLQGLYAKNKEIEFALFRRVIFECCSMIQDIEKEIV